MEKIRQAVERARVVDQPLGEQAGRRIASPPSGHGFDPGGPAQAAGGFEEIELDRAWLESRRIVGFSGADLRSRPFDMLRTQVLQSMDMKDWKVLGVTSPTAACGKTMTAVNLALSIARQHERSVFVVDLDLQKPQIAKTLGLRCRTGVVSTLAGRTMLSDAVVHARVDNCQIAVLPVELASVTSSEWMASRAMSTLLQDIRRYDPTATLVIDLPPVLSSDDVIAILPQLDCVLLVAAVGTSTVSEIKQCSRHLQSADVVRVVLNKVEEPSTRYYYGYASSR